MREYLEFFNNWADVVNNYQFDLFAEPEFIYAWYGDLYGYSGQSVVAYFQDGNFYLVTGSHCSCYGLEEQWEPERYTPEQFKQLLDTDRYDFYGHQEGMKRLYEASIEPKLL